MNQQELNIEAEAIRDQACKVLGWTRKDVDSFSLSTLRSICRRKNPTEGHRKLIDAIDNWQQEFGLGRPSRLSDYK